MFKWARSSFNPWEDGHSSVAPWSTPWERAIPVSAAKQRLHER